MATFTVKKIVDPQYQTEIVDEFRGGIHDILTELKEQLISIDTSSLDLNNPLFKTLETDIHDIDSQLQAISLKSGFFDDAHADIHKHPEIWAKSSRIGASKINVDDASSFTFTSKKLNEQLITRLKKYSRFKNPDRKIRKKINEALNKLDEWDKAIIEAYLIRLKDVTAKQLILKIDAVQGVQQPVINELKERIKKIIQLNCDDLRTSAASLEKTKQVNQLRNDIISFNKKLKTRGLQSDEFEQLAEQLSVVTKRWIDPYYEHPKELTKIEKARRIFKFIIINVAEVLAVTAFILFFVFPPASFPVGVAASIGMVPILDSFFEVARNIWHGRTPTKSQVLELGIAVGIVVGLTVLAYGVAAVGMQIVNMAPKIAEAMIRFGEIMATVFMRFIDVVLNTAGSFLDAILFKKTMFDPKTPEQLDQNQPLSFKNTLKIIRQSEKELTYKRQAILLPNKAKKDAIQSLEQNSEYFYIAKDIKQQKYVTGAAYVAKHKNGFFGKKVELYTKTGANLDSKSIYYFRNKGKRAFS